MASIRFISSSIIQAKNPSKETDRIELTPWDLSHLLVTYLQAGLLFQKPKPQKDQESEKDPIKHLETSLSRTLDFFAPLAGRFATIEHEDKTTSVFIDCNNAGALYVHAIAEKVTISDLIEPVYVPEIVYSFFQLNGVKNIEGTSKPLLAVQVTELVDGIFISCSINHSVVDGASFWQFFNSWSEISRGSNHLSKPPIFQRPLLDGIDYPIRIPLTKEQNQDQFIPPPLQAKNFYFTKQNIVAIKTKANSEMNTDKISTLQALLSHFWASIMRNTHLDLNQETIIFIVIGTRQKLQQFPEQYFGNAIQSARVTLKAGELVEKGLGNAAWEINKIVANHTEEKLMNLLESWANSPRLYQTGQMKNNALLIANSPRFDVYGNDFGWGRPIGSHHGAYSKCCGRLTVSPGVEEGSVEIKVCLPPETFQALEKDKEFMDVMHRL